MGQHPGVEERPTGEYFRARTDLTSQGDIFNEVPVYLELPKDDGGAITADQAMVLTASCHIDHRADWLIIAPVVEAARVGLGDASLREMAEYDCHHRMMYLPPEGDRPERVVRLDRQQAISRLVLELCDRDSQLSSEATRQLMRKLVLHATGNHFPRNTFLLAPDDFPAEQPD